MKYRPEIDGLRAMAVVPVVLFHAGFELFSGGFVGVDVFFVISGYLITTILIKEIEQKNFSLMDFYERRARRILPALVFVSICSLPFAWFWLAPEDFTDFSKSLIGVATFSSNFVFWLESGYFEAAAELKPLLHTWSLAVEEQYYILFPIVMMLTWRSGKIITISFLAIIFLLSLYLAQWGSRYLPDAAFFLLPTRGWEILLGAFCAFYLYYVTPKRRFRLNQCMSVVGLLLIVLAVLFFDKSTPNPSVLTLTPTLGTAFVILFASDGTFIKRLLSYKLIVGVGLVSYSTYLWHQPILVFWRHSRFGNSLEQPIVAAALSLTALLLGVLSYYLIERPFRNKNNFSRRQFFSLCIASLLLLLSIGAWGVLSKGIPDRLSPETVEYLAYFENNRPEWRYFTKTSLLESYRDDCNFWDTQKYRYDQATKIPVSEISSSCFVRDVLHPRALFIWGDSHAQMLRPGLDRMMPEEWQILQIASSGCTPSLVWKDSEINFCDRSNYLALESIKRSVPDVVIVAQALGHSIDRMADIDKALKKQGVRKVVFVGPAPLWVSDLPKVLAMKNNHASYRKLSVHLDSSVIRTDRAMKNNHLFDSNSIYFSLIDILCDLDGCITYFGNDHQIGISSFDSGHLTPIASAYVADNGLVKIIVEGLESKNVR